MMKVKRNFCINSYSKIIIHNTPLKEALPVKKDNSFKINHWKKEQFAEKINLSDKKKNYSKVSSGSIRGEAAAQRASAFARRALLIIPALLTSKNTRTKTNHIKV